MKTLLTPYFLFAFLFISCSSSNADKEKNEEIQQVNKQIDESLNIIKNKTEETELAIDELLKDI